ncbi:MAG: hypothetical protein SWX82_20710 [Cyanobacteriota bacterium]|nr:hypothetical protein [Cyanobacteriota bacterium]
MEGKDRGPSQPTPNPAGGFPTPYSLLPTPYSLLPLLVEMSNS